MKKMILIERSKFALLVRSHMKASNMLLVLQHVCRERRISLSMTQEEVCQLIRLDPDFVEKYKRRGKLCPVEDQDGKQCYNVLDFINLKDMQESKRIFYQTMEQAEAPRCPAIHAVRTFPEGRHTATGMPPNNPPGTTSAYGRTNGLLAQQVRESRKDHSVFLFLRPLPPRIVAYPIHSRSFPEKGFLSPHGKIGTSGDRCGTMDNRYSHISRLEKEPEIKDVR